MGYERYGLRGVRLYIDGIVIVKVVGKVWWLRRQGWDGPD